MSWGTKSMKKITVLSLVLAILFVFSLCAYGDSPITSTDISSAYMDNEMVKKAAASKEVTLEIAQFLHSDANPVDVKAAVINAIGWDSNGQDNAELYSNLIFKKSLEDLKPDELSGGDLFCIGYLGALSNYMEPQSAIFLLEKAEDKLGDSLAVSMVTAVVKAQDAFFNGKFYSSWKLIEQVRDNKALKQDLRAQAVKGITDYMQLYSEYFELESGVIQVEAGKSVSWGILGNSGPYKFEGAQVLEKDSGVLYMGPQVNSNIFSPNAKADITVSGESATFKGIHAGTVLASFSNKYGKTINVPVVITLPPLEQRLSGAVVLYVGSGKALVNNALVPVDSENPEVRPVIKEGRTLVPVRFISEKFGAEVKWDNATATATIANQGKTAKITVGSGKMDVGGKEILLDVPAEQIQNRLFIPLRKLAEEVLNKKVFYERGLIFISDNENIIDKYAEEEIIDYLIRAFDGDMGNVEQDGGMRAVIHISKRQGGTPAEDQLENLKSVIDLRLDNMGVWSRRISVDKADSNITVEVSEKYAAEYFNNKEALNAIFTTGELTFQEVDEGLKDDNGWYVPTNKIIVKNTEIESAQVGMDEQSGVFVALHLSEEGAKKFEEATGRLIGKPIGIFIGSRLLQAPIVHVKITGGNVVVTGQKDAQAAAELANDIALGAMDIKVEVRDYKRFQPKP